MNKWFILENTNITNLHLDSFAKHIKKKKEKNIKRLTGLGLDTNQKQLWESAPSTHKKYYVRKFMYNFTNLNILK